MCAFALVFMFAAARSADVSKLEALAASDGSLHLESNGRGVCTFSIGQFDEHWGSSAAVPAGNGTFSMRTSAGVDITGVARYETAADGALKAHFDFTPAADVTLNSLNITADFPTLQALAGTAWKWTTTTSGAFPR